MKPITHHIRKIRRQPEEVRRHILHVATIVCAVVLIMLWFLSLGANFASSEPKAKEESELQPFSVLKDNIVGGYKSISDTNGDMLEY